VELAIEAHDLTRAFGGRLAVAGLSLEIPRGRVFSLLGPNGAGKTTTVRMLATLLAPTTGTARVAGHDVRTEGVAIRTKVGFLPEQPGLYESLSARRNLEFAADLQGMARSHRDARIQELLRTLGIADRAEDRVSTFSKGMRQKIAIARALVHEPEILFLDEPTASLDPESARVVREYILASKREGGTIFLNTHNLYEAERVSDLVGVLRGRLLALGPPAALSRSLWKARTLLRLRAASAAVVTAVRGAPGVLALEEDGATLRLELADAERDTPAVVAAAVHAGGEVLQVGEEGHSLEDVYLQLVGSGAGA